MNIAQIENKLKKLVQSIDEDTFIYDLLIAYNLPKASITRLKKGNLNLSNSEGEISWKKKLFFKVEPSNDLHLTISNIKDEIKHGQRFIIVTDFVTLLAIDTKTNDKLDISVIDLPKYYDFFLPWAGMEKATHLAENPADVKAAEKMAKLFDEIKKNNPDNSPEFIHSLNVFFTRLLFCYFAEDTNIFEDNQFSYCVESHTQSDGSDLDIFLNRLFLVLDTQENDRKNLPAYLDKFPYVNGGLFKGAIKCPQFTYKSRQLLIESGNNNDWSSINPDIFGSMFQAVISPELRGGLGAHYTSVSNIMKVIDPLFLNELKDTFHDAIGNEKKLKELLYRISKIKLFDPACGSGNFLIIAYKELRRLEMLILNELGGFAFSGIHLNNFYGIELNDFAHEIAKLSLWLAEHQMNIEFFNEFGRTNPTLPLQEAGQIICGNACRLDWEKVCPKSKGEEIYILGNPPYLGARFQNKQQKEDIEIVLKGIRGRNGLDYISCWFVKASKYIKKSNCQFSFVSTNSICQGVQVSLLWQSILDDDNDIKFAHQAFYWSNNAKNKAVVAVIIVGVKNKAHSTKKIIFKSDLKTEVQNISPYLKSSSNLLITSRTKAISNLPPLVFGNQSVDGGHLIISNEEKEQIILHNDKSKKFIRKFYGWNDLSKNIPRWCIWITDNNVEEAKQNPLIYKRIEKVREFRKFGGQVAQTLIDTPYKFRYTHESKSHFIAVGRNSSETRQYLPVSYKSAPDIPGETLQVVYDPEPYVFAVISSKIHMLWVKAVAGGMKMDILYSVTICYNTFPFPSISSQRKEDLTKCTFRILEEREKYPEKTLAQLYDPDKMPEGLKEAHRLNDEAVERCYRSTPFNSDEERLEYLFKLYEKMIQEEKENGTLFEAEKKKRKKK